MTQGNTPSNFSLDPTGEYLFAANQGSRHGGSIQARSGGWKTDADRGTDQRPEAGLRAVCEGAIDPGPNPVFSTACTGFGLPFDHGVRPL
jgi:hypothetical protein